jgi:hypothetical protein
LSDLPMRLLAAELTREKLYKRLHQELPYSHRRSRPSDWEEPAQDGSVRIEQVDLSSSATARRRSCWARAASLVKAGLAWPRGRNWPN